MSLPQNPKPAKLVIGLFLKKKSLITSIANDLTDKYGPVDMVSHWIPFDYTSYYNNEMGTPLSRRIFVFKTLIKQSALAKIKIDTNFIEQKYSKDGQRNVNIDPGYLVHERFVLATGKNYTHRIYIGSGIYADLTLIYQKGEFHTLPWTYPDYAAEEMVSFLMQVRNKYLWDFKTP